MLQSIIIAGLLIIAVLFLPLWLQLALFVIAVFFVRVPLTLFIPAIVSDAIYSPLGTFSFGGMLMTLAAAVIICIHWLLITRTRATAILYGLEKS